MQTAEFDYDLPEQAIAQVPMEPRDQARLLVDRGPDLEPEHRRVVDLPDLVGPGDVLVVNTTRVLPARLRLRKPTGGAVEVLLLEPTGDRTWDALVRPSRRVPAGTVLTVPGADGAENNRAGDGRASDDDHGHGDRTGDDQAFADDLAVELGGDGQGAGTRSVRLRVPPGCAELSVLARHGVVPLPPYITTPLADPERYQTVFATRPESVAAPTAGLHLTTGVLGACLDAGARVEAVELVVGMGTFRPMTAAKVEDHHMHAERYRVPRATLDACRAARAGGGRVVAVGTTSVRALESAALSGDLEGRTELFIHRPWNWRLVDVLMTNFHLPRSSLLVLVDAFVGERWRSLYAEAMAAGYRFLSFGDAMWLARRAGEEAR
jgi:S-adenosylmethionine:tRNA ribosyltransferase-isomerase